MPIPSQYRPHRPLYKKVLFWLFLILVLIFISILGLIKWWEYQDNKEIVADRVRFAQAEKDVKQVADAIIAANGQPVKTAESKSCFEPSHKWEEVDYSCTVSYDLFYPVSDAEEATNIRISIENYLKTIWRHDRTYVNHNVKSDLLFKSEYFQSIEVRPNNYQNVASSFYNTNSEIECNVTNTFYRSTDPPHVDYLEYDASPLLLNVDIHCRENIKVAIYPLR